MTRAAQWDAANNIQLDTDQKIFDGSSSTGLTALEQV